MLGVDPLPRLRRSCFWSSFCIPKTINLMSSKSSWVVLGEKKDMGRPFALMPSAMTSPQLECISPVGRVIFSVSQAMLSSGRRQIYVPQSLSRRRHHARTMIHQLPQLVIRGPTRHFLVQIYRVTIRRRDKLRNNRYILSPPGRTQ